MTKNFCLTPWQILHENGGLNIVRAFCGTSVQTPFATVAHEALVNAAFHGSELTDVVSFRLKKTEKYWICAIRQKKDVVLRRPAAAHRGLALMNALCARKRVLPDRKTLFLAVERKGVF